LLKIQVIYQHQDQKQLVVGTTEIDNKGSVDEELAKLKGERQRKEIWTK